MKTLWVSLVIASLAILGTTPIQAAVNTEVGETPSMNSKIQKLKRRAETLHQDLAVLELDLLYPASSQMAVYVSMSTAKFDIDSIAMSINGKHVVDYLYSNEQTTAFGEGGVQQLYLDNIAAGYVDVTIYLGGKSLDAKGSRIQKTVKQRFHKGNTSLALELIIGAKANDVVTSLVLR